MTPQEIDEKVRRETLEALASYQKKGDFPDPAQFADMVAGESDRGVVVIFGSMIEDRLLDTLMASFAPLTNAEKKNLTRGGGLLSSFDDRINLAAALGKIDGEMIVMLQVLKAMRNACAHSRLNITFLTPELRAALALLFDEKTAEDIRTIRNAQLLRVIFLTAFIFMHARLRGDSATTARAIGKQVMADFTTAAGEAHAKHLASLEKRKTQRAKRLRSTPTG